MATNGDVDIQPDVPVDDAERNRCRRSIFISCDFFHIKEINPLIFSRFAAETETLSEGFETCLDRFVQVPIKNARFR